MNAGAVKRNVGKLDDGLCGNVANLSSLLGRVLHDLVFEEVICRAAFDSLEVIRSANLRIRGIVNSYDGSINVKNRRGIDCLLTVALLPTDAPLFSLDAAETCPRATSIT